MIRLRLCVRLAARLAFATDVRSRWRLACLSLAGAIATFTLLLSLSVLHIGARSDVHRVNREPVLAHGVADARLFVVIRGEIWQHRQFPVVWLEPNGSQTLVLPPGLRTLPDPGTAVLSPGMLSSGAAAALGFKQSMAGSGRNGTIGAQGLEVQSELLVYMRPAVSRSLGHGGNLFAVAGFNKQHNNDGIVNFETQDFAPTRKLAAALAIWGLLLPALILLAIGVGSRSPTRSARFHTLGRFGVTRLVIRLIAGIETFLLAAAGVGVGVLVWSFYAYEATVIPFADITVAGEALTVGFAATLTVVFLVSALAFVLGYSLVAFDDAGSVTSRRKVNAKPVSNVRAAPLIMCTVLMIGTHIPPATSYALPLLLLSLVLVCLTFPYTAPWLVSRLGSALSRMSAPHRFLAGRRMVASPTSLATPALIVGVLMFVMGASTGMYQRLNATGDAGSAARNNYSINWRGEQSGDIDTIRAVLPKAVVAVVTDAGSIQFRSCPEFEQVVRLPSAKACDGTSISAVGMTELHQIIPHSSMNAVIEPLPTVGPAPNEVLLFGISDAAVWRQLNTLLPAVNVARLGPDMLAAPLTARWLAASGGFGLFLLVIAAIIAYGNRILALTSEDRRLVRVALDEREVRAVQRWTLIAPPLVAVPVGALCAVLFVWIADDVELAKPATLAISSEFVAVTVLTFLVGVGISRLQRNWT